MRQVHVQYIVWRPRPMPLYKQGRGRFLSGSTKKHPRTIVASRFQERTAYTQYFISSMHIRVSALTYRTHDVDIPWHFIKMSILLPSTKSSVLSHYWICASSIRTATTYNSTTSFDVRRRSSCPARLGECRTMLDLFWLSCQQTWSVLVHSLYPCIYSYECCRSILRKDQYARLGTRRQKPKRDCRQIDKWEVVCGCRQMQSSPSPPSPPPPPIWYICKRTIHSRHWPK